MLVQNLKPGALAKLGYPIESLRKRHPASHLLLHLGLRRRGPLPRPQGLRPAHPGRVGARLRHRRARGAGARRRFHRRHLHRHARLRGDPGGADRARRARAAGADIRVSMFDSMMEWMAVPMLYTEYGAPPKRVGLSHTALAPYGVFKTADNVPILISIQNDREWVVFCTKVLGQPELARDPRFATNSARVANRAETDALTPALLRRPRRRLAVAPAGRGRDRFRPRQRCRGRPASPAPAAPHRSLAQRPRSRCPTPAGPLDGRGRPQLRPPARAGRAHRRQCAASSWVNGLTLPDFQPGVG